MSSVGSLWKTHQAPEDRFKLIVVQMILVELGDSQKTNRLITEHNNDKVMNMERRLVSERGRKGVGMR